MGMYSLYPPKPKEENPEWFSRMFGEPAQTDFDPYSLGATGNLGFGDLDKADRGDLQVQDPMLAQQQELLVPSSIPRSPSTDTAPSQQPYSMKAPQTASMDVLNAIKQRYSGELSDAEDNSQKMLLASGLAKAAGRIGTSIAGSRYDEGGYSTMDQLSKLPLEKLKRKQLGEREAVEGFIKDKQVQKMLNEQSPDSYEAQLTRQFLQKNFGGEFQGVDLNNLSAEQMDRVKDLLKLKEMTDAKKLLASSRGDSLQARIDATAHNQTLRRLANDKNLNESIRRGQNLEYAFKNIDQMKIIPKQSVEDLQTMVIMNMGLQGQNAGTQAERVGRYLRSLGWDIKSAAQFASGRMQDIGRDDPMYQYIRELAQRELGNMKTRIKLAADKDIAGNEEMYDRRKDLKRGIDSVLGLTNKQIGDVTDPQTQVDDLRAAVAAEKARRGIQ